jgi:hypothetical protein
MISKMKAKKVGFDLKFIHLETDNNAMAKMPLLWFSKLLNANSVEQNDFELWAENTWILWEKLREDLSVEGFFNFKRGNL